MAEKTMKIGIMPKEDYRRRTIDMSIQLRDALVKRRDKQRLAEEKRNSYVGYLRF